jgi:DNA ligase (NAD+)
MTDRFNLEHQYLTAKEAYYNGNPILSDDEFDVLESTLLSMGSDVPYIVGAEDRKAKYSHPSPMLSLAKYQATISGDAPVESATNWMKKFGATSFEITPKYDGNAANAIYQNGKLLQVLSRGNGAKGRDITDKVKHNLPETIDVTDTVEIRGEVVIKVSTFNEKYAAYKNPRNYVAGVLNRDENPAEVIADLDFIPLEVKRHKEDEIIYMTPRVPGFKHTAYTFYCSPENFQTAYDDMVEYRQTIDYQLDGFVIKAPEGLRPSWGENSHDPNWAVAIKFPPKEAITRIIDIRWNWGKTGEVTPVAIMEPIDLDGSRVSRASMFNFGYVKSLKAYPGATVAIAKSGDIIPQITRVITPGTEENFNYPSQCKCGAPTKIDGIHLYCSDTNCEMIRWYMYAQGVNWLCLDGIGGAMLKTLWSAGFQSPIDILNPTKFNKESLIATGHFKAGKTLDNLLEQVGRIKELKPADVIMMLGFEGMGHTTAKQVGNYLSGVKHSFHGLQKSVVSGFAPGEPKRALYESAISEISNYIKIVLPEKIAEDSIGYEMTGSPKAFGFKTKEEFVAYAKSKGYHHSGIKEGKVLFVDDINTSSSKMKSAQSKGLKIMLYSEI